MAHPVGGLTRGIFMRVLLIEDEATIAKSIELMLGTEGLQRLHHRPW